MSCKYKPLHCHHLPFHLKTIPYNGFYPTSKGVQLPTGSKATCLDSQEWPEVNVPCKNLDKHIFVWRQFWQQNNHYDCGVYVCLAFMYLFCNNFSNTKALCTLLPDTIPKTSPKWNPAVINKEESITEIRRTIFILNCMKFEFGNVDEEQIL